MMIFGMLLYIADFGSDIYVAYQYWKNEDFWWFRITVGFIIGPSIIINITAIIKVINYFTCFAAVCQFSIVFRYVLAIRLPTDERVFSLEKIRYLETITESAPQWCLQSYIMLRQWKFPRYTVVSIALSLLSLAWGTTCLEKARRHDREEHFGVIVGVSFALWQLFTLITRLSVIVMLAYVFRGYVFIFLGVHWFVQSMILFILQIVWKQKFLDSLYLSWLASVPTMFHASEISLPTKDPLIEMIIGYTIILLENITVVTLALTIEVPDAPNMNELKPIANMVIILGSIFSISFSPSACLQV